MIDRIFAAALTFSLLIGGTLAIGSAVIGCDMPVATPRAAAPAVREVRLERVVITAKRDGSVARVAMAD